MDIALIGTVTLAPKEPFMPKLRIIAFMTATQLCGCITVSVGGDRKEPDYEMATPAGPWEELRSVEVARAYRSTSSGAVLGVSSACDDVAHASYDALLDTVTASVPGRRPSGPASDVTAGSMPGRMLAVRGNQGGTPLEMMAIVLKSKVCVYDVTLTGKSLSQAEKDQAVRVAQSIKEKAM